MKTKLSFFEKLIARAGSREGLSAAEREKMRFVVREYAAFKPHSSVLNSAKDAPILSFDNLFLLLRRPALATVAAVLMLTLVSGTAAYAAEAALPGDVLYPIKVAVTEPVRVAVASSPQEKATLQMTFAERRIDEAATLANQGKLDAATEETLAINFTRSADAAADAVSKSEEEDPDTADVSKTRFAGRLSAYENVLMRVDAKNGTTTTRTLQAAIRDHAVRGASLAAKAEARATAPTLMMSTSLKHTKIKGGANTTRLQKESDDALHASADLIGSSESTLDASSSVGAKHELANAEAFSAEGRDFLKNDDEEGASHAFRRSLSATARLEVLTRAASALQIDVFATSSDSTSTDSKKDMKDDHAKTTTENTDDE